MLSQAKKCENQQNEQKIKLNSLIPVTQIFAKIHDFDGHVIGEVALKFQVYKTHYIRQENAFQYE